MLKFGTFSYIFCTKKYRFREAQNDWFSPMYVKGFKILYFKVNYTFAKKSVLF